MNKPKMNTLNIIWTANPHQNGLLDKILALINLPKYCCPLPFKNIIKFQ